MKPVPSVQRFALEACAWFVFFMLLWSQVSAWTSYPAAAVAQVVLDSQVYGWVESTQNVPGKLSARTRFRMQLPDERLSTPIAVVEPAHYAYGTILFLALLLASRSRKLFRRAIMGYGVLCLPQAISLVLVLLGQILRAVPIPLLSVSWWQVDAIVVGNMFGMLILPTLAPVALWLCFEWDYFAAITMGITALAVRPAESTTVIVRL